MKDYVLAHDLGTTGNKATLYDRDGALIASCFHAYETRFDQVGWAEQNPNDWWEAICTSTRALLKSVPGMRESDLARSIACIVFSGQMMGCVPLDKQARPLRSAIIWADQRAVEQERWLAARIGREDMYRITGHRLSSSYSLPKMLWLRDHQPDIYRETYKFVHAKDAMVARLTGVFVTEPSDASSMNLYDLEAGAWSARIIDAAGLNAEQLPTLIRSIDVAGELTTQAAEEVGLVAGTPVVIGGGDGACAAVGAGVISEGSAYNYVGSSSWIALTTRKPIYDPDQKTFTFGHVVPDMFMPTGTMQAAGASYQWARDQLAPLEVQAAAALGISAYEIMNLGAESSPVGANGLLYLPYLLGERSPRWNPRARGAFIGLTIRHTRRDMVRAVLEGITFNLRVILDCFRKQGASIDAMRVIGGGARGRFWNRIMADVYGVPIQRLSVLEEATSMGAAVVGGVGVGLYQDFGIIAQMNHIAATIPPDPAAQAQYDKLYPIFDAAYMALLPIYDQLAEVNI
ncbi:MAG: xylulokinase [Chloroflexota bacterium]|nr:xylulokinase [Chloroflexota bacterium]